MKLYWSIADIPELSTFSSAQRRRIGLTCLGKALRNRRFWLVFIAPYFLFFLVYAAILFYMAAHARLGVFTFACIAAILIAAGFGLVTGQFYFRFITPYVRELLPGYCSSCGYNLTGNASGVCPECGIEMNNGDE